MGAGRPFVEPKGHPPELTYFDRSRRQRADSRYLHCPTSPPGPLCRKGGQGAVYKNQPKGSISRSRKRARIPRPS